MNDRIKAKCNKCGLPIDFKRISSGKWMPINVDGSDHWDICSQHRNKGKVFHPISTGIIIGVEFKKSDCDCIPWDGCNICCPPKETIMGVKMEKVDG